MFLGLDRSSYPGDEVMASLYTDTSLYFTGFYLAPAPSHGERSWMSKLPVLREQGWGFLPTYVGQQVIGAGSHVVTAAQGRADALNAHDLMRTAGFAVGTHVYLDIENGLQMPANQVAYVGAWIRTVNEETSYWPGVYCSRKGTAAQILGFAGDIPTWVYGPVRPHPAVPAGGTPPTVTVDLDAEQPPAQMTADFPGAVAWQYAMSLNCVINVRWSDGGVTHTLHGVDLDCATVEDPSFSPGRGPKTRRFANTRDGRDHPEHRNETEMQEALQ
jgi:hypothetical protein